MKLRDYMTPDTREHPNKTQDLCPGHVVVLHVEGSGLSGAVTHCSECLKVFGGGGTFPIQKMFVKAGKLKVPKYLRIEHQ